MSATSTSVLQCTEAVEMLLSVSKMEEFQVGTDRASQVLSNISKLAELEGTAKDHLHDLYKLLETQLTS